MPSRRLRRVAALRGHVPHAGGRWGAAAAGALFWLWAASILVALFLGRIQAAVSSDFDALLATGPGLALLLVGRVAGGLVAEVLFSVTAVSLPLRLDRDVRYVSAM